MRIEKAEWQDLARILELQRLCYQSEVQIYQDSAIPPLTQTQTEMEEEFLAKLFLKAQAEDGFIVGSVRLLFKDDTVHVHRLIVHPDFQNRGIGTSLLKFAETIFISVRRMELFTGYRSEKSLYLYQKNGYRVFREERLSDTMTFVYLEKIIGE